MENLLLHGNDIDNHVDFHGYGHYIHLNRYLDYFVRRIHMHPTHTSEDSDQKLIDNDGEETFPLMSKNELAHKILDRAKKFIK